MIDKAVFEESFESWDFSEIMEYFGFYEDNGCSYPLFHDSGRNQFHQFLNNASYYCDYGQFNDHEPEPEEQEMIRHSQEVADVCRKWVKKYIYESEQLDITYNDDEIIMCESMLKMSDHGFLKYFSLLFYTMWL